MNPYEIPYEDLVNRFKFHPATEVTTQKLHEGIRAECLALAEFILETTPVSPEQQVAIERLEEVMMWSNAAIARHSEG